MVIKKLARDQQQTVTTVNALPNLNHAQQQTLTDAINAAPTRTEVHNMFKLLLNLITRWKH